MADYGGLDPAMVSAVQGGNVGAPANDYAGLDPSVVNFLQGGAPLPVQQVQTPEGTIIGSGPNLPPLQPPPPPPPPPQKLGPMPGAPQTPYGGAIAKAPDAASYGLHPDLVSHVQGGLPSSPPILPPPDDTPAASSTYGLSPAVAASVQNGFAPAATPDATARTTDALRFGAVAQQDAAAHAQQEAELQLNDANARIQGNYNERYTKQAATDQANEAQYQKDRDALMAQRNQQIADYAKYKVDTNRDIGTRGLIAIALSGIGDALDHKHGPNAALQILDANIDKRISDQYAQKNELGKAVGMTDGQLDAIARGARDRREAEGLQRATLLQQQANDLKSAALQVANPQTRARALAMAAERENQRAAIVGDIANRQAAAIKDQREQQQRQFENKLQQGQLGVAYGHLGLARDQFNFQKDQADKAYLEQVAAAARAGDKTLVDSLQKEHNDRTARGFVTETGWLKNKDGNSVFKAPEKEAETMHKEYEATLNAVRSVDNIRALREKFGGTDQMASKILGSTPDARQMRQELANAVINAHEAGGIPRFSEDVAKLNHDILTGGVDPDSMRGVLDALSGGRQILIDNMNTKFVGKGAARFDVSDPLAHKPEDASLGADAHTIVHELVNGPPLTATRKTQAEGFLNETAKRYWAGDDEAKVAILSLGANASDPDVKKAAREIAKGQRNIELPHPAPKAEKSSQADTELQDIAARYRAGDAYAIRQLQAISSQSPDPSIREKAHEIMVNGAEDANNALLGNPPVAPMKAPKVKRAR